MKIKKVGVVGCGLMGSGIAQKMAQEGLRVVMVDLKEEFVERGLENIQQMLAQGVERKIFTSEQAHDILSRIIGTADFEMITDADLVIEAVFEDKKVKSDLFQKLDQICSPETILATNTSSFYVKEFAEQTSRPDRFVGLHYFYHPAKNRLLEVIPHDGTSTETLEKSLLAAKLHGKTSIVVKDAPGFAVNRFFVPFLNEAARMLEEDMANIPTIEGAAKQAFKIGMGPFELMNVTGHRCAGFHFHLVGGSDIALNRGVFLHLDFMTRSDTVIDPRPLFHLHIMAGGQSAIHNAIFAHVNFVGQAGEHTLDLNILFDVHFAAAAHTTGPQFAGNAGGGERTIGHGFFFYFPLTLPHFSNNLHHHPIDSKIGIFLAIIKNYSRNFFFYNDL